MSTQVPVTVTAIPTPNEDPQSIVQSVLAIKQTIENQAALGKPRTAKTAAGIAVAAAISHVTKTLP